MIDRLIELSLKNKFIVVMLWIGIGAWGLWAMLRAPIDAIPDLSDNQVIVFIDWQGRSPQEVEDQITYPLTTNLQGLPGVKVVRSSSAFGFSMIFVIFNDDVDLYFARTRVLERLNLVTKQLPAGVVPTLGPDATGVGHVFWYTVEGGGKSLRDLRSLQDWYIRYQLNSVPGVAEVASVGGTVQQYQINVDPNRLRSYGIPLSTVMRAVMASNTNVGGNVISENGSWSIVRGLGLIENLDDIRNIVVGSHNGTPIFVKDLGTVQIGDAFRTAALVKDSSEAVGGVIVARQGENTKEVIDRVKAKIKELQPGLPPGVRIVPFYDRSQLIEATVDNTLRHALIEEIILVTLAHVVFLMHFRSILVVTIPLPLAVLSSFLLMHYAHVTSNVMSLAGIAIAIGVLVDAGIVVTENAFRHLEGVDTNDRRRVFDTILQATKLVGRPTFFSMAIIILAFVPVFALTGQEGKLFHPLAFAKTFAMVSATIIALTLVPILCVFLLRGKFHSEDDNPVMRFLQRLYRPVLSWALTHRVIAMSAAVVLFGGAIFLAGGIGSEFMPPLNEGDIVFMPIADPSISLEQNIAYAKRQDKVLESFPEVAFVAAKIARADTSTDPAGLNMTDTFVHFKPRSQWRPGTTLPKLKSEMDRAVSLPGVANIWTQPIINRIDMLTTGIRSEIAVKVFGSDLTVLESTARQIADAVRTVKGATDIYPEQVTGGLYLDIKPNREEAARYGIDVGEVQNVIETAIGENNLTTTIEGRQRFPVRVRYAPEYRKDPSGLANVLVTGANGAPPNWSPDGTYLLSNSGGHIYRFTLAKDGTAEPKELAIPSKFDCNNDKAISPDGRKLAFSATATGSDGSQVFLADADGGNIKLMVSETPSYFHGWSPDNKMLAFVAQRNGTNQFDIYRLPAAGGTEQQLTSNIHHDDGPDYSPDGKWIYINSDRSGKEAIWRFPADGAGLNDQKAVRVVNDELEDWFPHISPDGKKMVYIGYPAGTPTHDPRNVAIKIKLVAINDRRVGGGEKTLIETTGGQGTMNVNSWAPDSMRFAYVTYEALP